MAGDIDELTRKIERQRNSLVQKGLIRPATPVPGKRRGTHHGRPGGRLLEVILALLLVAFSTGVLVGTVVGTEALLTYVDGANRKSGKLVIAAFLLAMAALAPVWAALLKYYRYDPGTMRPIKPEETDDCQGD